AHLPLYDLDRMKKYDHRSCVLIPAQRDFMQLERFCFDDLVRIMRILQSPGGCPWDIAQTHESLRPFMLEETYEAIDAINQGDPDHLYDELGDLLMQVVMQAEIGRRHGEFDISDSITAICRKMIDRHTHIFGSDHVDDPDAVLDLWAKNKMKERGQKNYSEVLAEISHSLPALLRAAKVVDKSARAGVNEADCAALKTYAAERVADITAEDAEQKFGDALFALYALARQMKVDPEIALNEAADRYIQRFKNLEKELADQGKNMPLPAEEAAKYWELVKL
ncbi:MAG: nucleoside triphosphate pyrophosphohydrolase, partial [Clostridia bacterium]|nr:nucleoside triphosphate pyrophosphohydrolase [Clostridia bacterium]